MNVEKQQKRVVEELDALFSNTSVSLETTLACLEEIQGDLESKIDALKDDIERKEAE